jgi:prepilin-type N-terminal cleavage/methylation domain-containing protein
MKKNQGFTLIEVLVVIAIISLMMVWLLPQIAGGQRSVDEAQCRKQLQDIYAASVVYKSRNSNRLPSGRGVTFFWQLWDSGAIPKTDDGRRLFFCPEVIPRRLAARARRQGLGDQGALAGRRQLHERGHALRGARPCAQPDDDPRWRHLVRGRQ